MIETLFRKNKGEKRDDKKGVKLVRVRGEPHGSHFMALYTDTDKFFEDIFNRVNLDNAFHMTEKPFADMGKQFISAHLVELNDKLSVVTIFVMIKKKIEIATAYPVYWNGDTLNARIDTIYEWPIQIEANIEATVNDATVRFFATDFFMGRDNYIEAKINRVRLWLLGYGLRVNPHERKTIKLKNGPVKEVNLEKAELLLPYEKNGVLDEYIITGSVKNIEKLKVLDETVYDITVSNAPLKEIHILVNEKNMERVPKPGDMVETVGWLEGMHHTEKWRTLKP